MGKVKVLRPRPEHLKMSNYHSTVMEESSDEEAWFDCPSFSRQDAQSEGGQSVVNTNIRVRENVELEMGDTDGYAETPPRRKSIRTRVTPRRYWEEEDHTTQEKTKICPRMRKRRQSLAKQRDKSIPGKGWIFQTQGGGVRSASSPEAAMLEELVKK